LCNKEDGKFYHAYAFSDMIYAQKVERDEENKRYKIFDRSSCCYHYSIVYRVKKNVPIPISQFIWDSTGYEGDFTLFREELWKNGAWRLVKEKVIELKEWNGVGD